MFSMTTTALSTTIPAANANPAREITFTDRPKAASKTKVPIRQSGIVTAMVRVETIERRNKNKTMRPEQTTKTANRK